MKKYTPSNTDGTMEEYEYGNFYDVDEANEKISQLEGEKADLIKKLEQVQSVLNS